MKIIKTNQLDERQKSTVLELQALCNEAEGLQAKAFLSNEINFDKELPCFFLGYEGERLAAFLLIFMPTNQEGEITAFTHPELRRQGRFSALLAEALAVLEQGGVGTVLFLLEPGSVNGRAVLATLPGTAWQRSEYTMSCGAESRGRGANPAAEADGGLSYHLVTEESREICIELTRQVFGAPEGQKDHMVENALAVADRDIFLAYAGETPIGTFNLNYDEEGIYIYGLGILPDYQGRGYGRQLVERALDAVFVKGNKALLDVDTENPAAYHLYLSSGFSVDFQIDYYAAEIAGLRRS